MQTMAGSAKRRKRGALPFRVYLKTVNTPKQRVFSTCWAPFFLAIRRVFLQKMASSGGKSLAVGHISGFQIDPSKSATIYPLQIQMQEICVALFLYLLPTNYSSLKSALGFGFLFAAL